MERIARPNSALERVVQGCGAPMVRGVPPFANNLMKCFSCSCVGCDRPGLGLRSERRRSFESVSLVLFSRIVMFSRFERGMLLVANIVASSLRTSCRGTMGGLRRVTRLVQGKRRVRFRPLELRSRVRPGFPGRGCTRVIRGTGRCVERNSVFRMMLSGPVHTGTAKDLFSACQILQTSGPSPCVFCFSDSSVRLTNTSPRALTGLRGNALDAFPLTKAEPEKGAERRSGRLRRKLLGSRGRLTRRGVLMSLKEGSVKGVDGVKAMGMRGCLYMRHFSRMVRLNSAMAKVVQSSGSTISTMSTVLPTKALSKTPGFETYRVVRRLRRDGQNVCKKTVKCLSFTKGLSAYVTVHLICGGGKRVYVHSNTKVITSDMPRGRFRRYYGGTETIMRTVRRTRRKLR